MSLDPQFLRESFDQFLFKLLVICLAFSAEVCKAQHADVLVNIIDQQLSVNEQLFLADFRGGINNGSDVLALGNPGYATQQANQLQAGMSLSFDIVGPLLFSDGSSWQPANPEHYFELFRPLVADHSAIVTGQSRSQRGFLLAQADANGAIHEHIRFELGTETGAAPQQGVYAFQQILTSPSYADSDPFMLVFNNGLEASSFIQSVVAARQLITDSVYDCSGDGLLTAEDVPCVSDITQRDNVLRSINSVAGDLDGDQAVDFADFLTLSRNFGKDATLYALGDIDLSAGVGFPDFLILSRNFGFDGHRTVATAPEPCGCLITFFAFFCFVLNGRRKASPVRTPNNEL